MNLVTVCGHNTTMLYHMLKHYEPIVDEFYVIVYANHKNDKHCNILYYFQ